VELLRAYKSEKNGPLCFLSASLLLARPNPLMAQTMALRGLGRLSLADFRKEYAVFLDRKCPIGQFALLAVKCLREADDRDIQTLGSLLPPAAAAQFQQAIRSLRQNRKQPADQAVAALLDALWQNGLREYIKATLEAIEHSGIPSVQ
jgi:hypothetical protein